MTSGRRLAVVLACGVVALLTAWYAGSRTPVAEPGPAPGSVRLGPDAGEAVAAYLTRLPADLPPSGVAVPALLQFAAAPEPADALVAAAGTEPLVAVFRVPLPRVQTALRFVPLDPGVAPAIALRSAQDRAQQAAAADAGRSVGRPRDVAVVEAAALGGERCRCVVALVVRADRAGLAAVAARPGVRAVQAAPPGSTARELALAPLLPEQTERADPLPDDGPVPPA